MREGGKAMNDSKLRVPEEEEFAMSETPLGAETTSPITVLLADDHALVREGTRRLLEAEADIRVVAEAGDGQTAVAEAERCRPDVAIVDVAMPGMSGIEATRHIKERLPNVAILALTAYDDDQYVLALIEAGAAGFMLKDAGARELVEAVRAVHRGDAVLQPSVAARALRRECAHRAHPSRQHLHQTGCRLTHRGGVARPAPRLDRAGRHRGSGRGRAVARRPAQRRAIAQAGACVVMARARRRASSWAAGYDGSM